MRGIISSSDLTRYSLIYTLINKHKLSSVKSVLRIYGKNIEMTQGDLKAEYIDLIKVNQMKSEFLVESRLNTYKKMDHIFAGLQSSKLFGHKCVVKDCENESNEFHYIKQLYQGIDDKGIVIKKGKAKKLRVAQVCEYVLKRKKMPLCTYHYIGWHNKKIGFNDIDPFWM